jgi:thymidine phosphorylase
MKLETSIVDVIRSKRDGKELTESEIKDFISKLSSGTCDDSVHESQMGAFLMAVFLNGLSPSETCALTRAMTYSGHVFKWNPSWKGTIVDKHSTGGIGDKTSLILAPALAACGLHVPMVSGRGLDITGGTLDKLESIPGFNVSFSATEMSDIIQDVGCCIVGQTAEIVPADKQLYRIRDITATVDYENLIVASIISKKAAESLDALVLDIKVGSGALMQDLDTARSMATSLVEMGNSFGMKVSGFMTRMDSPLGNSIGNALEVAEAIESLQNEGPADLLDLVLTLGGKLLESTGRAGSLEEGRRQIAEVIRDGRALSKFERMIAGQGTDLKIAKELCHGDKWMYLPRAKSITNLLAISSGYIEEINALAVGKVVHGLGCGRKNPGQAIKYEPGVVLRKKPGDYVAKGEILMEVHHDDSMDNQAMSKLLEAVLIVPNMPKLPPLVIELIE